MAAYCPTKHTHFKNFSIQISKTFLSTYTYHKGQTHTRQRAHSSFSRLAMLLMGVSAAGHRIKKARNSFGSASPSTACPAHTCRTAEMSPRKSALFCVGVVITCLSSSLCVCFSHLPDCPSLSLCLSFTYLPDCVNVPT